MRSKERRFSNYCLHRINVLPRYLETRLLCVSKAAALLHVLWFRTVYDNSRTRLLCVSKVAALLHVLWFCTVYNNSMIRL